MTGEVCNTLKGDQLLSRAINVLNTHQFKLGLNVAKIHLRVLRRLAVNEEQGIFGLQENQIGFSRL